MRPILAALYLGCFVLAGVRAARAQPRFVLASGASRFNPGLIPIPRTPNATPRTSVWPNASWHKAVWKPAAHRVTAPRKAAFKRASKRGVVWRMTAWHSLSSRGAFYRPSTSVRRNMRGTRMWNERCQGVFPLALGAYYSDAVGCAPGDWSAVSEFKERLGRTPAVWMIFQKWTGWNRFPAEQARRARSLGSTLMVTWEPWNGVANDPKWNCQTVALGTYDGYIRSYARAVRASGVPVLIRFAHEMNGNWYPWSTAYASGVNRTNNNSPAMFCAMWRHVVSLFREEGALNARWVWSPNIVYQDAWNTEDSQARDLYLSYPGGEWVDWVGVSVYNDGARRPWQSFRQLFDSSYRMLSQISYKPLMIAELGVTEEGAPSGQTKAGWLRQALLSDIPTLYPRIRLVTYFCRDKSGEGESNYRFDSSPASLATFRTVANSPVYGGVVH